MSIWMFLFGLWLALGGVTIAKGLEEIDPPRRFREWLGLAVIFLVILILGPIGWISWRSDGSE